jgi:hypothetical protein
VVVLCRSTLESPELKVEISAHCWSELSACCVATTSMMSFRHRYTLSTPSEEGTSKVSKSATAAAMFWLALVKVGCGNPLRLMAAAMALA